MSHIGKWGSAPAGSATRRTKPAQIAYESEAPGHPASRICRSNSLSNSSVYATKIWDSRAHRRRFGTQDRSADGTAFAGAIIRGSIRSV